MREELNLTICPFFSFSIPGRKAFIVQKWAMVLTPNVLLSDVSESEAMGGNKDALFDISW
jgi:hypothetical protein